MIELLQPVLSWTLLVGILVAFVLVAIDKKEGGIAVGCAMSALVLGVWALVLIARYFITSIELDRPELLAHKPRLSSLLYVIALGVGNAWVLYALLDGWYKKRHPTSFSSPSMSDKIRIYDSDGKVVGYLDKD